MASRLLGQARPSGAPDLYDGYSRAHELFKRDFERRGSFSIGLRLKAMQRDLGLPPTDATASKP
jgi:hypothetical protein